MKIVADMNESHENTLKKLKRLGYILNRDINTKPQQIAFGMDLLQKLMWEFNEEQLIEIILKNNKS